MIKINSSNHWWSIHSNLIIFPCILVINLGSLAIDIMRIEISLFYSLFPILILLCWIKRISSGISWLKSFRLICIYIILLLHHTILVSIWRRCFILIMHNIMRILILKILSWLLWITHSLFLTFKILNISFW
jgi:hypothetical protein